MFCVQTAVDRATIAHMWHFMRDAYCIDGKSQSLAFRLVALNTQSRTVALWSSRLVLLPSGRLQSYATILNAPLLWGDTVSWQDVLNFTTHALSLVLSFTHTAFVSELHRTQQPLKKIDAALRSSAWFRILCQADSVGLAFTLLGGLYFNHITTKQVNMYSMQSAKSSLSPEFLPVTMYHNLLAPARMLLPAKQQSSSEEDGFCHLVSGGSDHSSLHTRARWDMTPI